MVTYCMGETCPIRNQCLRYTSGRNATFQDWCDAKFVRHCTNQRLFMQDENNVNQDSKRH